MATVAIAPWRPGLSIGRALMYVAAVIVMVLAVLPFAWALLTSLKVERQVYAFPPQLLPDPVTLYNYGRAVDHGLLLALFNSGFISLSTVGLTLAAGSLAAYPLARIRFAGSQLVLFLIIANADLVVRMGHRLRQRLARRRGGRAVERPA